MTLPLDGIKVIDLSRMAPGPFCTMVLADLGADVLKVEEFALSGRRAAVKGAMAGAGWLNRSEEENAYDPMARGKRSIGLNLKSEEARQVLYKLVENADVFVEEFRPGSGEAPWGGLRDHKRHQSGYCIPLCHGVRTNRPVQKHGGARHQLHIDGWGPGSYREWSRGACDPVEPAGRFCRWWD